jgi:23S rRNA pseudouridine1911/1915/1917 synthase
LTNYSDLLDVLYEDNHLLALNKPAGWASAHFEGTDETVDHLAKAYLKEKYAKPGQVFLGVVHRLDKPTSGVLLFARTSKAAARLSEQFRSGAVEKTYLAVVRPTDGAKANLFDGEWGTFDDWLVHNDCEHRVDIAEPNSFEAKPARLNYTVKGQHNGAVLLELRPATGRKHQLRVQLASRGWPIVGDVKYGGKHPFGHAIALHAHTLSFLHPTKNDTIKLTAEIPKQWRGPFAYLLAELKS